MDTSARTFLSWTLGFALSVMHHDTVVTVPVELN